MRGIGFLMAGLAAVPLGSAVLAAKPAPGVIYAKPPAWVLPPPEPTQMAAPQGAVIRVQYSDTQVRVIEGGTETFLTYRLKLLRPEALNAGNLTATWEPEQGKATIHKVHIIRAGKVIDVLDTTKFRVIQREQNLEQSALDGELTATLQVPGLQVGDELDVALTVTRRDSTLGDHAFGLGMFAAQALPGSFRYRVTWPEGRSIHWQSTKDLTGQTGKSDDGRNTLSFELRDPSGSIATEGAPPRYNVRRLMEFSDFDGWKDISGRFSALFDKAAVLAPNSPVRAEIARIAAASADPAVRAKAALALVQDRIRYVYVGLDGGNFRPASIDETWERRFGDCKAKTVLLLAMLRELGVSAEAVLVNAIGDDGLDERLPSPGLFNHVLVRARIAGKSYWLDGTRSGDTNLALLPPPSFRWGLPLATNGAALEPVPVQGVRAPQLIQVLDIDARGGFDKPAKVTARQIMRGDEIQPLRIRLASLSAEDATRAVKSFWREAADWIDAETAAWTFDEAQGALVFTVSGPGDLDWEGDNAEGRSLDVFGAGFNPPEQKRRPKEQDQTAPWAITFPKFTCWATTIRLPAAGAGRKWGYEAKPENRRLGGVEYWRAAALSDGVIRTVMSSRSLFPEISAAEAAELNRKIPGFNNNMSRVYEVGAAEARPEIRPEPFGDDTAWLADTTPCNPN